jgi:hypothetical protein
VGIPWTCRGQPLDSSRPCPAGVHACALPWMLSAMWAQLPPVSYEWLEVGRGRGRGGIGCRLFHFRVLAMAQGKGMQVLAMVPSVWPYVESRPSVRASVTLVTALSTESVDCVFGRVFFRTSFCRVLVLLVVIGFTSLSAEFPFQHCEVSPKLPVLPTTPAGPLPSARSSRRGTATRG